MRYHQCFLVSRKRNAKTGWRRTCLLTLGLYLQYPNLCEAVLCSDGQNVSEQPSDWWVHCEVHCMRCLNKADMVGNWSWSGLGEGQPCIVPTSTMADFCFEEFQAVPHPSLHRIICFIPIPPPPGTCLLKDLIYVNLTLRVALQCKDIHCNSYSRQLHFNFFCRRLQCDS